ncbi:hypothetical protein [Bacillus sp. PS06]|uniref:hypothetical protein n=1 Tax=Bacillus sp. PS06 TaxID=2764176 RepID=UPI001786BAAC|nr:hypothetical protein [Bacillus sp. PS06]MBD8069869.1 hypothetical protein [Bacillus sp. PS06]
MKKYCEFDMYEQEIAKELHRLFPDKYTPESAQKTVEDYYEVMKRIGWFCSPEEWAKNLHSVINKGITPEDWSKNLDELDKHVDFPEEYIRSDISKNDFNNYTLMTLVSTNDILSSSSKIIHNYTNPNFLLKNNDKNMTKL